MPLHGIIKTGMTDILTPNMNIGGTADIIITGSIFNITITDPVKHIIKSEQEELQILIIILQQKKKETIKSRSTI